MSNRGMSRCALLVSLLSLLRPPHCRFCYLLSVFGFPFAPLYLIIRFVYIRFNLYPFISNSPLPGFLFILLYPPPLCSLLSVHT